MRMRVLLLVTFLMGLVPAGSALAQRRQTSQVRMAQAQHRVEINAFGGYRFTFSRRVCSPLECGDVDIKDQGFWGVELDINVQPYTQLALLYDRQTSTVTFRPDFNARPKEDVVEVITEYWHIGGLRGIQQGAVMPFGSFTLGATRYNFKTTLLDDEWKFSVILGLGAKIYASDRLGLRIQGRLPLTFTSGSFGIGCGTGGCGTLIGGTGIGQLDFSGGVMLML